MKKRILHTDFNIAKYLFKSLFRDRSRGAVEPEPKKLITALASQNNFASTARTNL